jgi:hypothetical protein
MIVSVVSGTYNRLPHLKRMVESVRKSVGNLSYEVILVDGGSTDGTIDWCLDQVDVVLIQQGALLGAIKAFNAGAAAAQGDYVVFLNDDVVVVGDTIARGCNYLREHPRVGQVAFKNVVKGSADAHRQAISKMFGIVYGQCCVTPRNLGNLARWWGDEGMRTYGGDVRLSLRLYELGYPTVPVDGCEVEDYVVDDALRRENNQALRGPGETHPDSMRFSEVWKGRIPEPAAWRPASVNNVLAKAASGSLRTLRLKAMMRSADEQRLTMIRSFGQLGVIGQAKNGDFEEAKTVYDSVEAFQPDLLFLQAQRQHKALTVEVVKELRRRHPDTVIINWDGDTHYPLTEWHFDVARAVNLQLVVSPTLFSLYRAHGVENVGYWPIGIETEYLEAERSSTFEYDVAFLGAMYGLGTFPEAETRRDSVVALAKLLGSRLGLYGYGWDNVKLVAGQTSEKHVASAQIYTKSKMALSISQTSDLWGYTSDRLYNITATGCPALVKSFAGMVEHGYVDGDTCIVWSDITELCYKVSYYLAHETEREAIGHRGREMTLARHTWPTRLNGLFAMLGGLSHG